MIKQIVFGTMLIVVVPMVSHAGQGTIQETDSAIIIEYSGEEDPDVLAVKTAKERAEKQEEVDTVRQKALIDQSVESAKSKATIREQKALRKRESEEE